MPTAPDRPLTPAAGDVIDVAGDGVTPPPDVECGLGPGLELELVGALDLGLPYDAEHLPELHAALAERIGDDLVLDLRHADRVDLSGLVLLRSLGRSLETRGRRFIIRPGAALDAAVARFGWQGWFVGVCRTPQVELW